MNEKSNNISGNGSELKNLAASMESTSKIVAGSIGITAAIAGALTHGLMGGIGGLLVGGALGFAAYVIQGNIASILRALANVDDNVAINANKITAISDSLEKTTNSIGTTIKKELAKVNVVATEETSKESSSKEKASSPKAEPVKTQSSKTEKVEKAEKAEKTEKAEPVKSAPVKPAEPKDEPKVEPKAEPIKTPVEKPAASKSAPKATMVISDVKKEDTIKDSKDSDSNSDDAEPTVRTITFTPFAAPVQQEESLSPFSNPHKTAPAKKEEKKEITNSPFASAKEKPATSSAASPIKKSSLYRCEVCGNMVNSTPCPRCAKSNASAAPVEKKEEPVEEKSGIWAAATKPATASDLANKASTLRKEPSSIEAKSPALEPKKEEPKEEAAPVKRGSLYRCDTCGNMVNAVPCPRCAMKSSRAAKPDESKAPTKNEEKEDVNPIWAAASNPGGSSGGEKLLGSGQSLTSLNPTWAVTKTATEAPSWAKPAAKVEETETVEAEGEATTQEPENKEPAVKPMKPIWER